MRIVSKTTSGFVTTPIPPITMASLVAAPIGAFAANQGTLGVQVNDRDGNGVPGVSVSISGPATVDNPTNAVGCAIFAYVPAGSYTVTLNQTGWVDPAGRTISTKNPAVTAGTVSIETMPYDRASSVAVSFDTVTARDGLVPAKATAVSGSNANVPAVAPLPAGLRTWGSGPTFKSSISATGMFPFDDGYGMYGGGCSGADPTNDPLFSDYYDTNTDEFVHPEPGQAAPAINLRLPSTNVKVLRNGAPITNNSVHIVLTSRSPGCTEKFSFDNATDAAGWMTEPALPFGDYTLCVDAIIPNPPFADSRRKRTATLNLLNHDPAGISPALAQLDMGTGTGVAVGSLSGGACS